MRKFLSFLLLLVSVFATAQIQRQVVFDFTSPSSLDPTVTPATNGITVDVTGYKFKSGLVDITFERGSRGTGVSLTTQTDGVGNPVSYFLAITQTAILNVATNNGATLEEVTFTSDHIGDFSLVPNSPGFLDPGDYKYWSKLNDTNVTSVPFVNSGDQSNIQKIVVTYTEPTQVLTPTYITPSSSVTSLDKISLSFDSNMSLVKSLGYSLSGTDGKSYSLTASTSGRNVILSLSEPISSDGTYSLAIPAGSFRNSDGYENKALSYSFTVKTPKNTLNYTKVTPSTGKIEKIESPIVLSYDHDIKAFSVEGMLYKNGEENLPITICRSAASSQEIIISFDKPQGVTEEGIYTIPFAENIIQAQIGGTYNPEFTLTYEIGGTSPSPDPTPDPEESETMKLAKLLVANIGVGYPATNSEAYQALKNLTAATASPTDEELQNAIDAFYAESNIVLPTIGKWYYVYNENSKKKRLYLTVKNGELGVSDNIADATAFEANETMSFKTLQGLYLTTKILTDKEEFKELQLAKFPITESFNAKDVFGYLTITGYNRTTDSGKNLNAMALINHANQTIASDKDEEDLFYDETRSNAFGFIEAEKPSEVPVAVEMQVTLSPQTVTETSAVLSLTVANASNLIANRDADAYIANLNGDRIIGVSPFVDMENGNIIKISIDDKLPNTSCLLILPEGTIQYTANGQTFINKEISKKFEVNINGTVNPDPTPDPDKPGNHGDNAAFQHTYDTYISYPTTATVKDVELNDFTIGCSHRYDGKDFVVDETMTVELRHPETGRLIRTGHFKKVDEFPNDPICESAYQIVFETPITAGELSSDEYYTFYISPATFGDENFGKYINGDASIKAADCKVNSLIRNTFYIDNTPTGIKEVSTDTNRPTAIYDLMGRRVQDMSRPGIYIVNGKKVVKK